MAPVLNVKFLRTQDGKEWIELRIPGGHDIVKRHATDRDRKDYFEVYRAFVEGREAPGTPFTAWKQANGEPQLTEEDIGGLVSLGIKNMEQLASLSDGFASNGFRQAYRREAQEWLAGKAEAERKAEGERLRQRLDSIEARLSMLEGSTHKRNEVKA